MLSFNDKYLSDLCNLLKLCHDVCFHLINIQYGIRIIAAALINHVFNVVEIENDKAYVDVTKGRIGNMNMIRYDCFMLSNKYINRFWTLEEIFPCETMKYSYFHKNKTLFKDLNELRKYLNGCSFDKTKGEIRFLYDGKLKDNDYLEKIIEDTFRIRCGRELELKGYIVDKLIGNCVIGKR